MSLEIIKEINWVDIFFAIVLLRICYVSIRNGMPLEFFKLLGTIAAVYFSLHYYRLLGLFISDRVFKQAPEKTAGFVCFIILALAAYAVFVLLRQIFFKLVKVEPVPKLNKWAGVIFGVTRGFLFLSLIAFAFVISPLPYLKRSIVESYSGKPVFRIAPRLYTVLWNGFASKFSTGERTNSSVADIQKPPPSSK